MRRGLRFLGRRVATRQAEVDLVFLDGDTLVCCEVKTARGRPGECIRPGRRFSAKALARQARAARELRALVPKEHRRQGGHARVDLIEVWVAPSGAASLVVHRDLRRPLPRAEAGPTLGIQPRTRDRPKEGAQGTPQAPEAPGA